MIVDPYELPPPETPKPCASCKGTKLMGSQPCITCTPGQNCSFCGAKCVVSGPCGMCGHIITLKESGI